MCHCETTEHVLDTEGVTLLEVFCKHWGSNPGPLYLVSSALPLSDTHREALQPVPGVVMDGLASLN